MVRMRLLVLAAVVLLIISFLLVGINKGWIGGFQQSPYAHYPSLMPEVRRTMAVRFDPSYYYKGLRPEELAREMTSRWQAHGVNLVYFRAYDPQYGAFYRTDYTLNQMGEYGRYDLLGAFIKECKKRQIRIFAWMPVLNHAKAWEENPDWRSKTRSGDDYSASGLEFPLCVRNEVVRNWWYGFIEDLIRNYPELDGVDFAEPVVSWGQDDACFCEKCLKANHAFASTYTRSEMRAHPLSELLLKSISLVHQAGMQTCLTVVLTTGSDGQLYTPIQMRDLTGLDLITLLKESRDTLDLICPQFLWQDWKSQSLDQSQTEYDFTPQWTSHAVKEFMQWIDNPVEVVAHMEATDFPGVEVNLGELKESCLAALDAGAEGIDLYSSSLLDNKKGWDVFREVSEYVPKKDCLVLYDEQEEPNDAIQTGELLRHFNVDVTLTPISDYQSGLMNRYDNTFYVATVSDCTPPDNFINDLSDLESSLCWMGFNIEFPLGREDVSNKLDLEYLGTEQRDIQTVLYKGRSLPKEDPWLNLVKIEEGGNCQVLARVTDGTSEYPYAVRSGKRFWYFADVPTSYAVEGDKYLVFADLLHDILNEDHKPKQLAMVRIEDIHPWTDVKALKNISKYLNRQDVPFQVALVPFYVFPEQNVRTAASQQPQFVSAIRTMVDEGGTVVLHGVTHQRFGETTSDYEFWDPLADSPPEGQTPETITKKIEMGLNDLWGVGIYPLIWETPHYAGSQMLYTMLPQHFSIAMERRQAIDRTGTDQYFPYLIPQDRFGQTIVPENLGYIPLDNARAEVILKPARNMQVVRDGVASFFFHPFVDLAVLKQIVRAMKQEGFEFTNVADLPIKVSTREGIVCNTETQVTIESGVVEAAETNLWFPGLEISEESLPVKDKSYVKQIQPATGELCAVTYRHLTEATDPVKNGSTSKKKSPMPTLIRIPNHYGESCIAPIPMILTPDKHSNEADGFKSLLGLVGIDFVVQSTSRLTDIPPEINLLIIPVDAAISLSDEQIGTIVNSVRSGEVSLIASGFSPLADMLGVENTGETIRVHETMDVFYPDVRTDWNPPVDAPILQFPGDAAFFCLDRQTQNPLLTGSPLGKGRYLYLSVPLGLPDSVANYRYPYLLTHLFQYFQMFPAIRTANFEVYFNPAEREEISVEDLVKYWRRSGVRVIYTAAWQVFPEWTFDYERLIELAHTNAMLVYAWMEPPHVNDKFWMEHPQWREINALGQEAVVGWRKPMAFSDPDCRKAALSEMRDILERFDWDGVVLNRVGLESDQGPDDLSTYTPFHPSVQKAFLKKSGLDTEDFAEWKNNPLDMKQFDEFRRMLAYESLQDILKMLSSIKVDEDTLEIIVTIDPTRKHSGIFPEDIQRLKQNHSFLIQEVLEANQNWENCVGKSDIVQIQIAPSKAGIPFSSLSPTEYPTGVGLYQLLGNLIHQKQRLSLNSENSLYEVDMEMLPFLYAYPHHESWDKAGVLVDASEGAELYLADLREHEVLMDGQLAATLSHNRLLVPAGRHRIHVAASMDNPFNELKSKARLVDFSDKLTGASVINRGVAFSYHSNRRTRAVVSREPRGVYVDDRKIGFDKQPGLLGWTFELPSGNHHAKVVTEGYSDFLLVSLSLLVSNGIVVLSTIAVIILALSLLVIRLRAKH